MLTDLFHRFTPYEWVISNKLAGYAMGNAFLANSRKYHGLLVAGKEQGKRIHLVSSIEERCIFPSGLEYFLDTNFYKDTIYPEGYKLIKEYFYRPYPAFFFACPVNKDYFLKKFIKMDRDKNISLIGYENISSYPFRLELRPKFTFRDHHTIQFEKDWRNSSIEIDIFKKGAFLSKEDTGLFLYYSGGDLIREDIFYYQVYYPLEDLRGYEPWEDLFAPFKIKVDISPGETFYLLLSDIFIKDFEKQIKKIENRYKRYPQLNLKKKTFTYKEYLKILEQMLRDFITKDNIIAGFPWFYCWGRDTFIGLPALFYLRNGLEICYKIFKNYKARMKNGLIPNVIGEDFETNYNSVDSSLWFGLRIFQFLEHFKTKITKEIKMELLAAICDIISNYLENPSLPFKVDPEDGFIEIPDNINLALTWMDAMVNGVPVTPRYGKPIEVSALWYNLLKYAYKYLNQGFLKKYKIKNLLNRLKKGFNKYFNGELWGDRIYKNETVFEIRPNYIIALSLPFDIADKEAMLKGLELAKKELLTSYGLRSLSPRHSNYRKKYFGSQEMRDLAYHNGTVWVWLSYPYAELLKKVYKRKKDVLKDELIKLVGPFRERIMNGKMASIPEIYDGDNPFYPKGAHAQFWSTAAIFIIEKFLKNIK